MKMNKHLRLKHLLLNSLVITAFVTASIGTNSVAATATGSKTFSLKATNGKSASSGAGIIATLKKDRSRKTPKKGKEFRARTFVLGVSDGTIGINASPAPSNNSYVIVHYHDQAGKTLAPDKILQGKIGDTYFTSIQNIAGYSLSEVPANTTGTFSSSQQSVTYVYGLTNVKADNSASTSNKKRDSGVSSKLTTQATHKSQTKNATPNVANQADVTSRNLPQTGIKQGVQLSFQGLGFLSIFGGLIGTWCSRKGIKYS